ncbi:hypothetical protein ACQKFX_08020 [Cupriavidus metallidurans]|uniref:hypothetical protein n=1 Tax=Cupriavidus metallidurans TaxID=119219 RepID=UPI003D010941
MQLLQNGKQQFIDSGGLPLANGSVGFYAPGTLNPVPTYQDLAGTILNTNPITLDSRGQAIVWGTGTYRQIVKDASGVTIWDQVVQSADAGFLAFEAALADTTTAGNGDALLGVKQPYTGAVATTQHQKNSERVSVFDFFSAAQIADVLAGTWSVDVTAAVQAAINATAAAGKRLFVPGGTYKIVPATAMTDEAGSNLAALLMASNMYIDAESGAIFKIANGVSTDANPIRMSMFFSNQVLSNITFNGLTMDMNGSNNTISPQRASLIYNRFTQAHIIFSGTPGGVAARGENVKVMNCSLLNTAGVSSIVMCQSNSANVTISKNWVLFNNLFKNNGLDTDDHSSVFSWCDTVYAAGNFFTADTMQGTVGHSGGQVAMELAGPNQRFIGNRVHNYFQGNWIAPNYTVDTTNVVVANNVYNLIKFCAVDIYRIVASSTNIHGILITGNTVYFDDTVSGPLVEPQLKTPFQCATDYAVRDIRITNNYAEKVGTGRPSAFMNLATTNVGPGLGKHTHIEISGNRAVGFTMGVNINTNTSNGLGEVTIKNNTFVDFNPSGGFLATGVSSAGPAIVDLLDIAGNSFIETRPSYQFQYGINLSGAITLLHVDGNTYNNLTAADYYEQAGIVIATRKGRFNKLGFTPTWYSNSAISLGNGTAAGSYSINEKTVTYEAVLNVGSSTTFPGGVLAVSVPLNAGSDTVGITFMGEFIIKHGGNGYVGTAFIAGNTNLIYLQPNGTGLATNLAPVALAAGDQINVQVTYNI